MVYTHNKLFKKVTLLSLPSAILPPQMEESRQSLLKRPLHLSTPHQHHSFECVSSRMGRSFLQAHHLGKVDHLGTHSPYQTSGAQGYQICVPSILSFAGLSLDDDNKQAH